MRSKVLIVLLGLLMTLVVLILAGPGSRAEAQISVTEESTLRITDVLEGGGHPE